MLVNYTDVEWLPNSWIIINNKYKVKYYVVTDNDKVVLQIPDISEYGPDEEMDVVHDICESFVQESLKVDLTYTYQYKYIGIDNNWLLTFTEVK